MYRVEIVARIALYLVVVSGTIVLPSSVGAQSESEGISVKEAYKAGMQHYQKGEYREAVEQFRRVLDQQPHPVLYFNLSQSYIRLGEWKKAAKFAEKADEKEGLDAETTVRNRASEAGARVVIRARDVERPKDQPGAEGRATGPTTGAPSSGPPKPPTESRDEGGFGTLGWAGVGAGVAGLGLGTWALLVDANLKDEFTEFDQECTGGAPQPEDCKKLDRFIQREQRKGRVLLYSGVGLLAVGGGLVVADFLTGSSSGESSEVRPTVWIRSDGAAFGLRGRY